MNFPQIYVTRFIAAFVVVVYHFGLKAAPFGDGWAHVFLSYGNEAVNYFFFLSGFVMVAAYYKRVTESGKIDKFRFWVNRAARIYPMYFVSLLLVACYYGLVNTNLFTNFWPRFVLEIAMLQSWFGKTSLNFPGWSLSVECLFYIAFPFLITRIIWKPVKVLLILFLSVYIINQLVFIYLLQQVAVDSKAEASLNYSPFLHLATFFCGNIAGVLCIRYYGWISRNGRMIRLLGLVGGVAMLAAFVVLTGDFKRYHHNGLLTPVYAIFLTILVTASSVNKWLGNSFFIWLGDISYSIYILQYPVMLFYTFFRKADEGFDTRHFWEYAVWLLVASAIFYQFFERRAQKYIRNLARC